MQAILTKYIPATNYRRSRIKATCERGSVTIGYPHELSGDAVHRLAVHKLLLGFIEEDAKGGEPEATNPWNREFITGCLPDGTYAHVFI